MRKLLSFAVIVIAGIFLTVALRAETKAPPAPPTPAATPPAIGTKAPSFTLKDLSGKDVSLSDFAGKTVVLEWTNPDCPFVQRHYKAGTMTGLAAKYKDVVWLAIATGDTANTERNQKFVADNKIAYPILADPTGTVGQSYGAKSTPDLFVIDKDGKLAYSGAIDDDADESKGAKATNYVAKALDEIAAGKAVSTPETKSYGCSVKYKE